MAGCRRTRAQRRAPRPSPLRGSAPRATAPLASPAPGAPGLRWRWLPAPGCCALPRPFRALRPPAVGAVPAIARSGPATVGVLPHRAARPATTGPGGWAGSSAPGAAPSEPGSGGRVPVPAVARTLGRHCTCWRRALPCWRSHCSAGTPVAMPASLRAGWQGLGPGGQNCDSSAHGSALCRAALPS